MKGETKMNSILDVIQDIRNLPRIPCNLKIFFYSEMIGGIEVKKVAICNIEYEKEVEKAKDFEYCKHCITMYESQYEELFKPLFENIGFLNHKIKKLQDKI